MIMSQFKKKGKTIKNTLLHWCLNGQYLLSYIYICAKVYISAK